MEWVDRSNSEGTGVVGWNGLTGIIVRLHVGWNGVDRSDSDGYKWSGMG